MAHMVPTCGDCCVPHPLQMCPGTRLLRPKLILPEPGKNSLLHPPPREPQFPEPLKVTPSAREKTPSTHRSAPPHPCFSGGLPGQCSSLRPFRALTFPCYLLSKAQPSRKLGSMKHPQRCPTCLAFHLPGPGCGSCIHQGISVCVCVRACVCTPACVPQVSKVE